MSSPSLTTTEQHGLTAHSDGPVVPIQTRSERPHSFDPDFFGVPNGREVNWKLSPVDRLAPLFAATASDDRDGDPAVTVTIENGSGVVQPPLAVGQAPRGEIFQPEDRTSALAWTLSDEALHLRIAANEELSEPVWVHLRGNGHDRRSNSHIVIDAQPNSKGIVVLEHEGSAQLTQNVEIIVRDGADLTIVTVQEWEPDALHTSLHQARVDRDGSLRHIVASVGGAVVRVNPSVRLAGTGSECDLYGVSFADSGQHLENQVFMFHEGENTRGDVLYKGALQGAGARTVWVGDVLIGPDAVGTDSYEANRNLVLTTGARADSIPNLEIENGSIRGAGHASATGRFDDEQLFYLQSRGIPEDEARRLVVRGFLVEIVQKIPVESLRERLTTTIENEIASVGTVNA